MAHAQPTPRRFSAATIILGALAVFTVVELALYQESPRGALLIGMVGVGAVMAMTVTVVGAALRLLDGTKLLAALED